MSPNIPLSLKHEYSLSVSLSLTHTITHTHKHHFKRCSHCRWAFVFFLFCPLKLVSKALMLGLFPFLHELWYWKIWLNMINKGTYWLNKTIQTTPTKTFRNRCMETSFPILSQPFVLHSSPLWLLACSTGPSQDFGQWSSTPWTQRGPRRKLKSILCLSLPHVFTTPVRLKNSQIWDQWLDVQPHLSQSNLQPEGHLNHTWKEGHAKGKRHKQY